MEPYSG